MSENAVSQFPEIGSSEYQGLVYAYSQLAMPVALLDSKDEWLFLNPAALNFLGISSMEAAKEIAGKNWGGRLKSSDMAGAEPGCFVDTKTSRALHRTVTSLRGKDGETVRLETLYDDTDFHENDERAKTMIDAAPLCCNYWNDKLENIDCNLEAVKLFDLPDKDTYLKRFAELSPEVQPNGRKSEDEAVRHITNAFRDGYERFEWMHQKLNGEPVPAEITLVKVHKGDKDVVLGYTRDLRSSKSVSDVDDLDWMTNIFNSLPFPVGVASAAGKWMFMNRAGLEMLGKASVEELADVAAANWGGRLEPMSAEPGSEVSHYFDKQADAIYIRSSSPLKDSFGGLVGRVECLQDVTDVYEAEERIHAMIDAAPLCCNFWNQDFQNIDCNLEAAKLFDLPDKKTYLDRFFELSPELQPNGNKSSDEALKHITTAFKEGFDRFEWMHQKLNGDPVPSEITLVRVNYRKGDVVLGYTRDLRK